MRRRCLRLGYTRWWQSLSSPHHMPTVIGRPGCQRCHMVNIRMTCVDLRLLMIMWSLVVSAVNLLSNINSFTSTDRFSSIQNNEWKSPLKLLSVERVNSVLMISLQFYYWLIVGFICCLLTLDLFDWLFADIRHIIDIICNMKIYNFW